MVHSGGKVKLKIAVFLIILVLAGNVLKIFINDNIKTKVEIDESGLSLKQKDDSQNHNKIDINKSEYEDFIAAGFSKSQAEKISVYKDFAGDIFSLDELSAVKGFGRAGIEKAKEILYISDGKKERNRHNINKLNEENLKLTGFTNKEIKIILPVIKNKKIRSNIELLELIGSDRYADIESRVKYYD